LRPLNNLDCGIGVPNQLNMGFPQVIAGAATAHNHRIFKEIGDPGWIRTSDPQLRRLMLYPAELRGLRARFTCSARVLKDAPSAAFGSGRRAIC
jgi:hypothetical protein